MRNSGDWIYTFTQEWPIGSIRHQFSYTVPVTRIADSPDRRSGIGDIALNYRYQLVGDGEAKVAMAPRFSVIVPSGDENQGRGLGGTGYQTNWPLSLVLSPTLVAHTNAGYTWTSKAKDGDGNKADLSAWNVGQSFIWLAHQRFNVMLEAVYSRADVIAGAGRKDTVSAAFVSPGVRWSYDFDSGLQEVHGLAFPMSVLRAGTRMPFSSISAEHPFRSGDAGNPSPPRVPSVVPGRRSSDRASAWPRPRHAQMDTLHPGQRLARLFAWRRFVGVLTIAA